MPDINPSNTPGDQPAPPSGDESPQVVVIDAQSGSVRVIALTSAGITVGRLANNALHLDTPIISRTHARIDWDGSRATITDLGSKSGTRLGHVRLTPQTPQVWEPGQEAHIGPYTLRLQIGAASPARPSSDASPDLHAAPTQRVAGSAPAGLALALSSLQTALTLTPGELADVEVRVTNRTAAPLTVALALEGLPESWIEPAPTLRVPPFSMKTTSVRVKAPATSEGMVRPYDVRLRAMPQEDPSAAAELTLEWRVAPFLAGEMNVSPKRVRGRDQAVVTVHLRNNGNTQAAYYLRAGDERQMLSAAFAQDDVTLAPGETADVPLTIAAPRRTFGADRGYALTVEVEERDDIHGSPSHTLRDEVRFVHTALLPAWSPLALLALIFLFYGLNIPSAAWSAVPGSGFLAGTQGGGLAAESARVAARATQQAAQGQTALAEAGAALAATQSAVAALPTEQQASAQTALAGAFQATVTSLAAVQTADAQALAATGAALEAQQAQTAAPQNQPTAAVQAPTSSSPAATARSTATPSPAAATPRPTTTIAPSPTAAPQPTTVAAASGEVDPASIAFGSIKKGTTGAPRTLVLKNTGSAPLTINEIVIGGVNAADFARVSGADTCGASLAPGASCTVTLAFTPAAAGQRTGQLRIETSSAGGVLLVSLSGAGTEIPEVASIVRVGNSPTNAASVQFQVNFSEAVKGVSASSFSLVTLGGAVGASIVSVSPASGTSANQWTVTVNAGGGNKTIRLDVVNSSGVTNVDGNAVEKLPFNAGDQIVIDTTAPTVVIGNTPPQLTNNPATPFTFSGSDDVSPSVTFECRIDNASFAPCTSPFTPSGLADGSRTFNVRSRDQAGNVSASAAYTWMLDTAPPDTSISGGPANSSTTGPTVAFTFTSEPGATFQCRVDSGSFSGCTSPFTITNLTDGSHTFSVRAIDAAGNVDASPASRTWTVDATPPDTSITGGPAAGSTTGPNVSFTFASEAGATFECRVDAGAFSGCTSPFTITSLASGSHTFSVRAIDAAGNVDASPASRTWTVDATPPDTSIAGGPTGVISATSVTFTFTSTEAGSTFQCRLNAGIFTSCTSPHAISGLTSGPQTFEVRAIDAVGNIDPTPATRTWTVDTQPPETTITSGPTEGSVTGPSVTFNFTSSEPGSTFECSVDGGPFLACSSPQNLSLANGAHTFQVRAIDAVGNVDSSPASRSWTVDAIPPTVTSVTSSTPDGTYGVGASINVTVNFGEPVVLSGGSLQVMLNTGVTINIAPFSGVSASGTYVVGAGQNTPDLNSTSLTLTAGATLRDAAGNNAVLTIPAGQSLADLRNIVIDTTPPSSPTVTNPISATTVPSMTTAFNISGTAEANSLVEVWNDTNDNGVIDGGESVVALQQLTGGGTSFSISVNLVTGANNFVVTATDAADNRSTPADVPTITRDT